METYFSIIKKLLGGAGLQPCDKAQKKTGFSPRDKVENKNGNAKVNFKIWKGIFATVPKKHPRNTRHGSAGLQARNPTRKTTWL
jgi:hypothetical protein